MPDPMAVTLNDDGTFTMQRGAWSATEPLRAMPNWLRLYRGLCDRAHGRYRSFYDDPVRALERAQREARA
ncbi:hypothetical protein EYE35_01235 [Cereibacter sphaeroides]|nr:hypothetical protein EYE35_01235 [Cereibacter sphaeroides]